MISIISSFVSFFKYDAEMNDDYYFSSKQMKAKNMVSRKTVYSFFFLRRYFLNDKDNIF
jgi:hypothetical protein